jgi:YidC/Oxa1 family membrane protein insertase
MRTEIRFLLAIVLMIGVLVITNVLFPPTPPEEPGAMGGADSVQVMEGEEEGTPSRDTTPAEARRGSPETEPETGAGVPGVQEREAQVRDTVAGAAGEEPPPGLEALTRQEQEEETAPQAPGQEALVPEAGVAGERVRVQGPLYTLTFSTRGARLASARLTRFQSFTLSGPVELIHEGGEALGNRVLVGQDTLDLRELPFQVEPEEGLELEEGDPPATLRFSYSHPEHPFTFRVEYTFHPDLYVVEARGTATGVDARVLFTDLGHGIPFNEVREDDEVRASAYVLNHLQDGIQSRNLDDVEGVLLEDGPFRWVSFKSKYFVFALLAGSEEAEEEYLGGAIARDVPEADYQVDLAVTQTMDRNGNFDYRLFMGPQEFARLSNLGTDMQNVNPYGWKFFRPIVRPFVGIIVTILTFLHDKLNIGYGWVLVLFGVMMRVVLFPLNQKAMRAQLRNMAVQPLIKEIQEKHKDNPEKLQKEMMKLYKEHGFNPVAGCLPMLLPWPVLIALFFVFQNTIELRGVPFLWLPDLSTPDPYFILPAFLGLSMFLLQWVSLRSMPDSNPQMKMMMWIMPIMMVFIFFNLASGLNLYYATANIATLPQQIWIAQERKKARKKGPVTASG